MEIQYLKIIEKIDRNGNLRSTRNGETRAIFAAQMRHDLRLGLPILTTKSVAWKIVVAELLWFIEGGKNSPVPYRMSNDRFREILGYEAGKKTIWSHDEGKPEWQAKQKFATDCGRIYGAQWRNWNGEVDQIANLINLLRKDPVSRYMKVTAWNPADVGDMCLPPCHGDFQCFVAEENGVKFLDLHMVQRSCDMFLGVPFNIASYAIFMHMIAQVTDMVARELVITLNDAHIYEAHRKCGAITTQLARTPGAMPRISLNPDVKELDDFTMRDIEILDYHPQEKILAPLL